MSRIFACLPTLVLTASVMACGGEAKVTQPAGGSASPAASAPAASASPGGANPATDVVEIKVSVSGGKVAPESSVHKVSRGQTVRLVVTSDKADELHVHGYDKSAELPAGTATTLEFPADQTGRFEVETHESGLQLLQLEVR
jgi:plastocyanin